MTGRYSSSPARLAMAACPPTHTSSPSSRRHQAAGTVHRDGVLPRPKLLGEARQSQWRTCCAGIQVTSAVETAPSGIITDIKPANVLTSEYGRPGLTTSASRVCQTDRPTLPRESVPWSPRRSSTAMWPVTWRPTSTAWGDDLHAAGRPVPFEVTGGEQHVGSAGADQARDLPRPVR